MSNSKDALQALLTKISGIVTGVVQDSDSSKEGKSEANANYLAWCTPGLPVQAKDLKFLGKGTSDPELLKQAADFAQLANIIPEQNVMQRFRAANGSMLWDVYKKILDESQVRNKELTESEQKTLDKNRAVLGKEVEVPDEDDDSVMVKKYMVSAKVKAYEKSKKAYEDAAMEFNKLMVEAALYNPAEATKEEKAAYMEFQRNGATYKKRVQTKLEEWAAEGYKNEVEGARTYIKQIQEKNATIIKAEMQARMDPATNRLTDAERNIDFYFTGVIPTSFASEEAEGWTKVTFSNSETKTFSSVKKVDTDPSLNLGWGFWKVKAGTEVNNKTTVENKDTSDLKISFSITQTPIMRNWFSPEFILSQGWKLGPQSTLGTVSDGKGVGPLPAYPTTAIWIKDVKITSKAFSDHVSENYLKTNTDVSVGWGPFSIGGKTTTESTEKSKNVTIDGNTVTIKGYQIIAFLCYKLPLTPNPTEKPGDIWV
ncbi:MAG: hypothetical protein EOP56_13070 [Sphingobacteriales bacterium]|nr:MAG: hypothetical protein EOP56_13070 [Sphingobacteriales bacterium]